MRRRVLRVVLVVLSLLGALIGGAVVILRASLPKLDGASVLPHLQAEVVVERDGQGSPTIAATTLIDVDRALGFLHAQDRFFQMDLLRRSAAGELAELFGSAALELDRERRRLRFRARAQRAWEGEAAPLRARIEAYGEGVNAGLAALRSRPFEYWILRQQPQQWSPQDSYLVLFSMFLELQDERNEIDLLRDVVARQLPSLAQFLFVEGTPWDAPLLGSPGAWPQAPDSLSSGAATRAAIESDAAGSNAFALGAARTAARGALLASDMHLGLRLPNIWYRARLHWQSEDGRAWDAGGLTLPGAPGLVAGSNGHLAWAFTNSYADAVDWVELADADSVTSTLEILSVAGAAAETLQVRESRFGPLLSEQPRRALAWVALNPGGADLRLLEMMQTAELEAALALLTRCGIPTQNVVLAAADGRVAWTLAGRLPRRRGSDGRRPWTSIGADWQGLVEPDSMPRWIREPDGEIWSANARPLAGPRAALLGDAGFALGARAAQIRDGLQRLEAATPADLLAIQLDDRALFLGPWRDLLLSTVATLPAGQLASLRESVEAWGAAAATHSAGYRAVREFRLRLRARLLSAWLAPVLSEIDLADLPLQAEAAVWVALRDRPAALLPPGVPDWESLLRGELEALVVEMGEDPAQYTWGQGNRLRMAHPLAASLGPLARWLRMEAVELPGDSNMPRVQGPSFGAPARFVVSPGREAEGILHAAGGISGHPLSPFFAAGHEDWVRGTASPFWPGAVRHRLRLTPNQD